MYSRANLYQSYHHEGVMTANPIELVVMLYDGLIKNLKLAKIHMASKSIEKTSNALIKAQDILDELMRSLDLRYSLASQLMNIYEYMIAEIRKINMTKDAGEIDALITMLEELKEAWKVIKSGASLAYAQEE